jgi:ketosteroid isomerase-like protein
MDRRKNMNPFELIHAAMKFNERINQRDADGLGELMTENHVFIDSNGKATRGKTVMKQGWRDFFERYPDYRNDFNCVTVQDGIVVMVGRSICSFKLLNGSNVWTAKVKGNKVSEWRVIWLDKR